MPALFNPSLTISLDGKDHVLAVVEGEVFLSPLEQCMFRQCPEGFNHEFTIGASLSSVDWGNSMAHLFTWPQEPLRMEEGQNRKAVRFEHRFRRGGTLNEDALPGQADEIVGHLRLETVLPAGPSWGLFTQIVTGQF